MRIKKLSLSIGLLSLILGASIARQTHAELIVAVGGKGTPNEGVVTRSTDGGQHWSTTSPPSTNLLGVTFPDQLNGWAAGSEIGFIMHTSDGGATWSAQSTGIRVVSVGVDFVDAQNGWFVGRDGYIIHTADGGATWTQQFGPLGSGALPAIDFTDLQHGWAVGSAGTILATIDGGVNWLTQVSGTSTSLSDVSFADALHGLATASINGKILQTADGGLTWNQRSIPTGGFNHVTLIDDLHGWATGSGGIAQTSDGGLTWSRQKSGSFGDVAFADPLRGWVIDSSNGAILHTDDGGATWHTQLATSYSIAITVAGAEITVVPEPSTLVVAGIGTLLALSYARARRTISRDALGRASKS